MGNNTAPPAVRVFYAMLVAFISCSVNPKIASYSCWKIVLIKWKENQLTMVSQMLQNSTSCTFIFKNLHLCAERYIYIEHFVFIFSNTHFLSTWTKIIFIQQKYLFSFNQIISFNNNICETSIHIIFIQQNYLFSFYLNYIHLTTIFFQLQQ